MLQCDDLSLQSLCRAPKRALKSPRAPAGAGGKPPRQAPRRLISLLTRCLQPGTRSGRGKPGLKSIAPSSSSCRCSAAPIARTPCAPRRRPRQDRSQTLANSPPRAQAGTTIGGVASVQRRRQRQVAHTDERGRPAAAPRRRAARGAAGRHCQPAARAEIRAQRRPRAAQPQRCRRSSGRARRKQRTVWREAHPNTVWSSKAHSRHTAWASHRLPAATGGARAARSCSATAAWCCCSGAAPARRKGTAAGSGSVRRRRAAVCEASIGQQRRRQRPMGAGCAVLRPSGPVSPHNQPRNLQRETEFSASVAMLAVLLLRPRVCSAPPMPAASWRM